MDKQTLIELINERLDTRFSKFREIAQNPTNKGQSLEQIVEELLADYFQTLYEFHTNASLLDSKLNILDDMKASQNEFDVVGSYQVSNPRLILDLGENTWLPLTGVSLICELKSTLTKGNLGKDLKKFSKIKNLESSSEYAVENRTKYSLDHIMKILIYDETEIAETTKFELLETNQNSWDLCLEVENDTLTLNPSLNIQELFETFPPTDVIGFQKGNALSTFLILIALSIPQPLQANSADTLISLVNENIDLVEETGFKAV